MPEYEIVPARQEHIRTLAPVMRQADVEEVWAITRDTPYTALRRSVLGSRDPKTGLADGRVVCMFGVANCSLLGDVGHPWLLASDELPQHFRAFLRRNREYVKRIRQVYPVMRNYVDARNLLAVRWLRWLGFSIYDAQPMGPDQLPFHPFEMVTPCADPQQH